MNKIYFTLILFLSYSISAAFAQTGIKGVVTDSKTKDTLVGTNVVIGDSLGTATDVNGNYTLNLKPGIYEVIYRLIGYETQKIKTEVTDGSYLVQNVMLKSSSKQLDEVVISAGKFEQKLSEVTVSMELIKPALVNNKNTTDMSTIVNQIPGVSVVDKQANIRGGSGYSYGAGSRVLIMVDDMPMLTADAGDAKWDFLPVENLEQVEVMKGASSALYGSSALNGVVHFRTSYPRDKPETKIVAFSGMYNRFDRDSINWWGQSNPVQTGTSFYHSRKINNLDLVVAGNYFSDEGYRKYETNQRERVNINTRYRFKKITGLSAGVNANVMYNQGGTFFVWQNADSGALVPQSKGYFRYWRNNIDPFITYFSPKGDKITLRTRFFRSDNNNVNNVTQNSVADIYYSELQYQKKLKNNLTMTGGFVSMYSQVKSKLYGNHNGVNYAGYYQIDKKVKEKLNLSFGMRGEYFRVDNFETQTNIGLVDKVQFKTIDGITVTDSITKTQYVFNDVKRSVYDTLVLVRNSKIKPVFRFGASYELTKSTFLRASFGQGYRFPSVAERYIKTNVSGLYIFPNTNLQPETGWTSELGVKQGFKISDWTGYLDVAAFWSEYSNMMQFTSGVWGDSVEQTKPPLYGFGFKSININQARITGTDISLAGKGNVGKLGISVLAGYTYINPIDLGFADTSLYRFPEKYGNKMYEDTSLKNNLLKYRSKDMIKADLQLDYKGFSFGSSYRYNSFMKNIDPIFEDLTIIAPGLRQYRKMHNKGVSVFDMRLSYQMNEHSKVAFIVNNVFNVEYMLRPADIQAPRLMTVQWTLTF